jgi:hypothetical protein
VETSGGNGSMSTVSEAPDRPRELSASSRNGGTQTPAWYGLADHALRRQHFTSGGQRSASCYNGSSSFKALCAAVRVTTGGRCQPRQQAGESP